MIRSIIQRGILAWSTVCLFLMVSLWKITLVFGSRAAYFSSLNILGPLSGRYMGFWPRVGMIIIKNLMKVVCGISICSPLGWYLPTFCASLYWSSKSSVIRFWLPLLCMFLFICHPVGQIAWYYALYWLIPVILYLRPQPHLFFEALGSTFIAHAVGSVLWIYFVPSTPGMFYALLPIVPMERIVFASGMVVICRLLELIQKRYTWFISVSSNSQSSF